MKPCAILNLFFALVAAVGFAGQAKAANALFARGAVMQLRSGQQLIFPASSFNSRARTYVGESEKCRYTFAQNPIDSWGQQLDSRFSHATDWSFDSTNEWLVDDVVVNYDEIERDPEKCISGSAPCINREAGKVTLEIGQSPRLELSIYPNRGDIEISQCLEELGFAAPVSK